MGYAISKSAINSAVASPTHSFPSGVNFINILSSPFLYKSLFSSFSQVIYILALAKAQKPYVQKNPIVKC
jgi:hypothetical protein